MAQLLFYGGKSLRQRAIIRNCIDKRGLPYRNFLLARLENMVSWNSETGEVKTIEYNRVGSAIELISYDESWVYKKFMEHSDVTLEQTKIR